MICPIAVAIAAPAIPQWNTPMNRTSPVILSTPEMIVTISPSFGFSAVTERLPNAYCSIKNGSATRMIRPYRMQSASIPPFAPRKAAICGKNRILITAITRPETTVAAIRREKISWAFSRLPSPIIRAIRALPPVPNINPMAPTTIRNGIMKLTAANGVFPTKFDTKYPSTTP